MRVISRRTLKEFYAVYQDAKPPLETWYHEANRAKWNDWTDIKAQYASASPLKNNRVVFNIGGNKYRLVVQINYPAQRVYVKFVGTHKKYDKINAEEI
jgi:mRNA interferase HigB